MIKILFGLLAYAIEGGFFTITAMSIAQGKWWYTFSFSTLLAFWTATLFFMTAEE